MAKHQAHHHPKPIERLWAALKEDQNDLITILIYTLFMGLLSLVVPVAAQVLVNTIAAGVLIQPVVILSLLVLFGLLFAGSLRLLQFYLVEIIQQRIFARIALRVADHVSRLKSSVLAQHYGPELMNRFFDTLNIQKNLAKLLLEFPAATLQIVVGLILLGVYSPILLVFNLVFLLFIWFICSLGKGGIATSILESEEKYKVAHWLEELARCHTSFKTILADDFLMNQVDEKVVGYIQARKDHFQILIKQFIGTIILQSVASAGILALGGWQVIHRELTLGQLVAAELVVLSTLSALDKLMSNLPNIYDLLTAYEKVGHLTDYETDRTDGTPLSGTGPCKIEAMDLSFSYRAGQSVLSHLNLTINAGSRICIVGQSGTGKTTLASLIAGLLEPTSGTVLLDSVDIRNLKLQQLRHIISLISDPNELFSGTIEENILMGRDIAPERLQEVLNWTHIQHAIPRLSKGLKTELVSEGRNVSLGFRQKILTARAIVDHPRLLILDEAFTGVDQITKTQIIDHLFAPQQPWTILSISHDPSVILRCEQVITIDKGTTVETGTPMELLNQQNSVFKSLFPDLNVQTARGLKS
jgi:ABC-type bacteriocin/lantibiotic exporter with double-glycine peptidase domain